jgi:hypothetical protein
MTSERPTHILNVVSGEGKSARFTEVAALWPTRDGNGFTGDIPACMTITGRIVILKRQESEADAQS